MHLGQSHGQLRSRTQTERQRGAPALSLTRPLPFPSLCLCPCLSSPSHSRPHPTPPLLEDVLRGHLSVSVSSFSPFCLLPHLLIHTVMSPHSLSRLTQEGQVLGQKGAGGTREWLSQQNQLELSAGPQKGRPVTSGRMLRVAVSTPPSVWGPHVGSEMCHPTLGGLASTPGWVELAPPWVH